YSLCRCKDSVAQLFRPEDSARLSELFGPIAEQIVATASATVLSHLRDTSVARGLSDDERRRLAAYTVDDHLARELVQDVVQAFTEGRHSLRKLQMMVSDRIAIRALRQTLDRFSIVKDGVKLPHLDRRQYASAFFVERRQDLFRHLGLPFMAVRLVDP